MELIAKQTNINFMGQRKLALAFSVVLLIVSIAGLAIRGLNFGLDFTGGTLIDIEYSTPVSLDEVRNALQSAGYGEAVVQTFGSAQDIVIRLPSAGEQADAELSTDVMAALPGEPTLRRVEFVGPQVGDELARDGGLAMIYALAGILIYVTARFQWKFSVGAVAALVHDVIIVLGFFALTQHDFDLSTLAAILAVIGYSLNDTIVVYDRIRENLRHLRKGTPLEIFNLSINQMLSRTLMTSLTTLLVLLALFVFGGEIIEGFAIALIVGVIIGTYSSVFVAGTALLMLDVEKADLMPPEKEGADLSHIP